MSNDHDPEMDLGPQIPHRPECDILKPGGIRICDCGAVDHAQLEAAIRALPGLDDEEETRLDDSDTAAGYEGQGSN